MSIVIPTRNRQPFVRDLVASILEGVDVPAEIVIVDQSDEADAQLAGFTTDRDCSIVYHLTDGRGLSAARNGGILRAQSDLIVFTDDDMLATTTWFTELVSSLLSADRRTVVTGQVRSGEPEAKGGFAPSLKTDEHGAVYTGRAAANVLFPNNMALFRTAFDDVGSFDERLGAGTKRFPGGEDNDFCFRLLEAGYQVVYEPRALLYHRAWRSETDYVGLRWRYGRGQGGFYGKHLSFRDRYILGQLTGHVVSCVKGVVRNVRRPRLALGSAAYGAGIVTAVAEWVLLERMLRRTARRTPEGPTGLSAS